MKIGDILQRMRGLESPLQRDPNMDVTDTGNKRLESLRRIRIRQLEDQEEEILRKVIKARQQEETTERIFGSSPLQNNHSFKLKRTPKTGMFAGRGKL